MINLQQMKNDVCLSKETVIYVSLFLHNSSTMSYKILKGSITTICRHIVLNAQQTLTFLAEFSLVLSDILSRLLKPQHRKIPMNGTRFHQEYHSAKQSRNWFPLRRSVLPVRWQIRWYIPWLCVVYCGPQIIDLNANAHNIEVKSLKIFFTSQLYLNGYQKAHSASFNNICTYKAVYFKGTG